MTIDEAMKLILDRLCQEWRRHPTNAALDRTALQEELDIPATLFGDAIRRLITNGYVAYVYVNDKPTSVGLDHAGVAHCGG